MVNEVSASHVVVAVAGAVVGVGVVAAGATAGCHVRVLPGKRHQY